MDPLTIASLVGSAIQGIGGLAQGIGGARKQRKLWESRPMLGVTEGERANDQLYKQLASATEMPGQREFESKLGETYAQGISDSQKGAISSLGATQSAVDLASKKMQAIQDLAGTFAEFKAQRQEQLGQWNKQKTALEQERFQINEYEPWNIRMNEAVSQKQAGFGSFGGGINQAMGTLGDLQGTNAYLEILKSLKQ